MVYAFDKDYGIIINLQPYLGNSYGICTGRIYQWSIVTIKNGKIYNSVYVSQAEGPQKAFEQGFKKLQELKKKNK